MIHDDLAATPEHGEARVIPSGLGFALSLNRSAGDQGRPIAVILPASGPHAGGPPPRTQPGQQRNLAVTLALGCLLLGLGNGCARDNAADGSAATAPSHAGPPPLDLGGDAAWPAEYGQDALWLRASTGDDLDQARLARRESSESLLAAVRSGGSLGRLALRVLPYASDRREARGALCSLLDGASAATAGLLLAGIYEVVMNGPQTEESVDKQADATCTRAIQQAVGLDLQDPGARDLGLASLERLRSRP